MGLRHSQIRGGGEGAEKKTTLYIDLSGRGDVGVIVVVVPGTRLGVRLVRSEVVHSPEKEGYPK